jgi:hypothetical protein
MIMSLLVQCCREKRRHRHGHDNVKERCAAKGKGVLCRDVEVGKGSTFSRLLCRGRQLC